MNCYQNAIHCPYSTFETLLWNNVAHSDLGQRNSHGQKVVLVSFRLTELCSKR